MLTPKLEFPCLNDWEWRKETTGQQTLCTTLPEDQCYTMNKFIVAVRSCVVEYGDLLRPPSSVPPTVPVLDYVA